VSENRAPERQTYTVEEAAAILGIARATAYIAVRDGSLPTIRIGRRLLVPRAQIDRMLGLNDERPAASSPGVRENSAMAEPTSAQYPT
jgi:excisionase family DNA binding protein